MNRSLVNALVSTLKAGDHIVCTSSEGATSSDIKALRELRGVILSNPDHVEYLAETGVIQILIAKLEQCESCNQLKLIHILVSLGYLIQKSNERSDIAVNGDIFKVLLNRTKIFNAAENILLLAVQVVTFLVDDSQERFHIFCTEGGGKWCLDLLEKGFVKSALLNARLAMLLVRICTDEPDLSNDVCEDFIKRIAKHTEEFARLSNAHDFENDIDTSETGIEENICVTLVQGLGLVLDNNTVRGEAALKAECVPVLLNTLSVSLETSTHLSESICWSLTYLLSTCPQASRDMIDHAAPKLLFRMATLCQNAEDGFISALGSVIHRLVDAIKISQNDDTVEAFRVCNEILVEPVVLAEQEILKTKAIMEPGKPLLHAMQIIMRRVRRILKVLRNVARYGGTALMALQELPGFENIARLLQYRDWFPQYVTVDILQEYGLLVEVNTTLGLRLARLGVLQQIHNIITQSASGQELCVATRALACFVEHNDEIGNQITDLAFEESCEEATIAIVSKTTTPVTVAKDEEVLLNSVGALGYMIKRRTVLLEGTDASPELCSSYCLATITLANMLNTQIGESLRWNSLWALIYLINGPCKEKCITTLLEETDGVATLAKMLNLSKENLSLTSSAAKALYHLIDYTDLRKTLSLDERHKVLAYAARVASCEDSVVEETATMALQLSIDPLNILESSYCTMKEQKSTCLRHKSLQIRYKSIEMEQVGIDAGGIRRDWLSRLSVELFNPQYNLVIPGYRPNDSIQISPKPVFGGGLSYEEQRQWYRVMGRIFGISVLYGDPLGVALVPSFAKLLLDENVEFEDIKYVSTQYYQTFTMLKKMRDTDYPTFVEALHDLTFTVNSRECMMTEAFDRDTIISNVPVSPMPTQSPCKTKTMEALRNVRTLDQLATVINDARLTGDRDLIRKALILQNELRTKKSSEAEEEKSPNQEASTEPEAPVIVPFEIKPVPPKMPKKRKLSHFAINPIDTRSTPNKIAKLQRMMSSLVDGGDSETINEENFDTYVDLLTRKLLVENVAEQIGWIKEGFDEIIPRSASLKLIDSTELKALVEGDRSVSVESWREHTQYKGGSVDDTPQIQWFWQYVTSLNQQQRQALLLWATGWRSIGATGFSHRPFTIELTNVSCDADNNRLPSVATCGFHMWLPKYSSIETLSEKFDMAVSEIGFGNC